MSLATISGVLALASLQGSLVALPDARAFGRLRRFRSPAWALLLWTFKAWGAVRRIPGENRREAADD